MRQCEGCGLPFVPGHVERYLITLVDLSVVIHISERIGNKEALLCVCMRACPCGDM